MVIPKTLRFSDAPVLSLRAYERGTASDRTEFLYGLQKSWDFRYGGQGFGKFIETGLDTYFTRDLVKLSRKFFEELSSKQKEKYNLHCRGQRGYTGFGVEGAKNQDLGDLKEIIMWGRDGTPGEPRNINPQAVKGFKKINMAAYDLIEEDNKVLYRAVAKILDVNPEYFEWDWEKGRRPNSSFRNLYYPAIEQGLIDKIQCEAGVMEMPMRAAEHGDINRVTWLYLGDSSEGLQVKQSDGSWDDVHVSREFAVVNVGDILAIETDGIFPSAIHRVIVTNPELPRYSFPCFTHPAKGKYLRRLLIHPDHPGEVYRKAFAEVYRPQGTKVGNEEILDLLHPDVLENLGQGKLRIAYNQSFERRLADIGLFNDDHELKARVLKEFDGRIPALCELEEWEQAA